MTKNIKNVALLGLSGLGAGLVNGLLGAGGGIVAVWGLGRVLSAHMTDRRDAFANALLIMLPLTAVSLIGYAARGLLADVDTASLLLPALAGGLGGALILDRINVRWLKIIFAALVVYSGFFMLFK